MPYFLGRWAVVALLTSGTGGGWLFQDTLNASANATSTTTSPPSGWTQFWGWAYDQAPLLSRVREGLEGAFQYFEQPGDDKKKGGSWESKLWMFADAVFSIVGWLIFGSAWQGVRSGCHRLLKILVVLLLCLVAHYVWAICWPVISLCTAVILGVIWVARTVVKKLETLIYWAQRAAGGVPEATGAEFIGPGTGRIPETSDLRTFKKTGTQDKWVLVRREGHVAVFKLGSENQTIRTAGLYVSVEPDTLRGDSAIVDACRGHDRLHLCRHLNCAEEGQRFKEYCLSKDFDPEKFQLRSAELEAAKAGRTIWAWLWSKKCSAALPRVMEFGSESETEAVKCQACRVRWSDRDQDVRLSRTTCSSDPPSGVPLLFEDQFDEGGAAALCARHALDYERQRRPQGCKVDGCDRVGVEEVKGLRLCKAHASERRPSARKRSPARLVDKGPGGDDPEEPELPARGDDGQLDLRDVRMLLAEVKGHEEKPVKVARTSRSPGHTPKSSIQRNLARLEMLDSPDRTEPPPALEDFFDPPGSMPSALHGRSPANRATSFGSTHSRLKAPAISFLDMRMGTLGALALFHNTNLAICSCFGWIAGGGATPYRSASSRPSGRALFFCPLQWSGPAGVCPPHALKGEDRTSSIASWSAGTTRTRCLLMSFQICL